MSLGRQAARAAQQGAGELSVGETANVDIGSPSSQSDERGGSASAFRVRHFCYTSDDRGAPHMRRSMRSNPQKHKHKER